MRGVRSVHGRVQIGVQCVRMSMTWSSPGQPSVSVRRMRVQCMRQYSIISRFVRSSVGMEDLLGFQNHKTVMMGIEMMEMGVVRGVA
jgi:hypothetical protein